jgi:16S rRNA (guanine966-N2)-methyltransferase
VRIIGGRVGGRTLKAPRGARTRPTSDKVREAIFNILAARMDPPARVLDLYCGSGALGLEALSRGAGAAVLVDDDRDACDLVRDNARALGFADVEIVCMPVVRWLAHRSGPRRLADRSGHSARHSLAEGTSPRSARLADRSGPARLADVAAGEFGWVFLDPPYDSHRTGELDKALDLVGDNRMLAAAGVCVAEHDWRHAPNERYGSLALFDRRRYGQTAVSFYEEGHG